MRKSIATYFKRIDLFGSSVGFTFGGEASYKSVFGALLSLVVYTLTTLQLYEKWIVLVEKGDTNYSDHIEYGANNSNNQVGFKETNFNFAFAIVPNNFTSTMNLLNTDYSDYMSISMA